MINIQYVIQRIESRYNAEHDLPTSGDPLVTWTDNELLFIIRALLQRIEKLEELTERLNARYYMEIN